MENFCTHKCKIIKLYFPQEKREFCGNLALWQWHYISNVSAHCHLSLYLCSYLDHCVILLNFSFPGFWGQFSILERTYHPVGAIYHHTLGYLHSGSSPWDSGTGNYRRCWCICRLGTALEAPGTRQCLSKWRQQCFFSIVSKPKEVQNVCSFWERKQNYLPV